MGAAGDGAINPMEAVGVLSSVRPSLQLLGRLDGQSIRTQGRAVLPSGSKTADTKRCIRRSRRLGVRKARRYNPLRPTAATGLADLAVGFASGRPRGWDLAFVS